MNPTVAGAEVVLYVCVEVPTKTAGLSHELRTQFDVNGASESVPGQSEAVLRRQSVVCDPLQHQVVHVVGQLQTERTSEKRNIHAQETKVYLTIWDISC